MIALIGSTSAALATPAVEAALAHWPRESRPAVEALTFERVLEDESALDDCSIAWVVVQEADHPALSTVLAALQDAQLPAMLTRPGERHPAAAPVREGIVVAPPDAPPSALCIILRTLWAQSAVVRNLRREVRYLQAHQGGLCDQIGKIDEELRLAAQLQREFLPQDLPRVGGVEIQVLFRPAGYVSGDIYDVVRLDEHHVGVFIADAVGHGVPAALMTMYIKRCLHTKAIDAAAVGGYRITPPDEALALLNRDLVAQLHTGKVRFATACYVVIDCRTLEVDCARAGHPFPMIVHADGSTESIAPDGAMLGVFPDETFGLTRTRLRPGDRLLLYSDGFEMAFPTAEEPAEPGRAGKGATTCIANQQYCEEFKDLRRGTVQAALARLERKLDEQIGSLNQRDDITAICIGVAAPEAPGAPGAPGGPGAPEGATRDAETLLTEAA